MAKIKVTQIKSAINRPQRQANEGKNSDNFACLRKTRWQKK